MNLKIFIALFSIIALIAVSIGIISKEESIQMPVVDQGCYRNISGRIKLANPQDDSQVLVILSNQFNDDITETLSDKDNLFYDITIPLDWKQSISSLQMQAFHFNKQGEISETISQLNDFDCNRTASIDIDL